MRSSSARASGRSAAADSGGGTKLGRTRPSWTSWQTPERRPSAAGTRAVGARAAALEAVPSAGRRSREPGHRPARRRPGQHRPARRARQRGLNDAAGQRRRPGRHASRATTSASTRARTRSTSLHSSAPSDGMACAGGGLHVESCARAHHGTGPRTLCRAQRQSPGVIGRRFSLPEVRRAGRTLSRNSSTGTGDRIDVIAFDGVDCRGRRFRFRRRRVGGGGVW